jgi:hypothetical protein
MKITEGPGSAEPAGIPRKSIEGAEQIPNVAVFLKRTGLEFLQLIFASRAQGHFRFDHDDSKTEIQISDIHAVDITSVGVKPSIVAVRGPLTWQGLGLGGGAVETRNVKTGKITFNDLLTGSVAFSCFSREGIEAEQIAHLVFNSFKFFRPTLQKYGFFTIKSLNVGAEALVESEGSDDKLVVVPVYVTAQIQDRWSLDEKASRRLERVIASASFAP